MNGEEQTFFRELLDEKFNNLHHRLNDIRDDIHAHGEKIATLPCMVHEEKIKAFKSKQALQWGAIATLFGLMIWVVLSVS